jgi:hypothetical protein
MGTRSLTHIIETYQDKIGKKRKTTLLTMYRQYDGYPSGHGADLVEFLEGSKVVNGYGMDNEGSKKVFNGAGCLAAQMVAHFKKGVGGFYIQKPNASDCGEEYTYELEVDGTNSVTLRCYEIGYMAKNRKGESIYVNKKRLLFEGQAEKFLDAVKEIQEA